MAATLLDSWLGGGACAAQLLALIAVPMQTLSRLRLRVSRQVARLVLGSLVNGFTNYRNVKGEHGQKSIRVTEVTHVSSGLSKFLHT
jgi:hypothetical protein